MALRACITAAEREGLSPVDACPGGPGVRAVEAVADRLLAGAPGL